MIDFSFDELGIEFAEAALNKTWGKLQLPYWMERGIIKEVVETQKPNKVEEVINLLEEPNEVIELVNEDTSVTYLSNETSKAKVHPFFEKRKDDKEGVKKQVDVEKKPPVAVSEFFLPKRKLEEKEKPKEVEEQQTPLVPFFTHPSQWFLPDFPPLDAWPLDAWREKDKQEESAFHVSEIKTTADPEAYRDGSYDELWTGAFANKERVIKPFRSFYPAPHALVGNEHAMQR